jgi:hypothetical protein
MSASPHSPESPNGPDGIDTQDKTVPPYEGRRETADVGGKEQSTKDGVKTAGATGPVEDDEQKAPDPAATPGGATGSPADEQPASQGAETDLDDDAVGPAHTAGTARGEDQS